MGPLKKNSHRSESKLIAPFFNELPTVQGCHVSCQQVAAIRWEWSMSRRFFHSGREEPQPGRKTISQQVKKRNHQQSKTRLKED